MSALFVTVLTVLTFRWVYLKYPFILGPFNPDETAFYSRALIYNSVSSKVKLSLAPPFSKTD